jgi:hypothetical protein
MTAITREEVSEALLALPRYLQNSPIELVQATVVNSNLHPHYPFPPKLSGMLPFSVQVRYKRLADAKELHARFLLIASPFGTLITLSGRAPAEIKDPVNAWLRFLPTKRAMAAAKARIAPIKEELMATAWHPRRVERWLVESGWDMLES